MENLYLNPDIGFIGVTERYIGVCVMDGHIFNSSNNLGIPNSNATNPSRFQKNYKNYYVPINNYIKN